MKIISYLNCLYGDKKAQAILEFALILPIFLLMIFWFIEISLALFEKQQLTHTANYAVQIWSLTNDPLKIKWAIEEYYSLTKIEWKKYVKCIRWCEENLMRKYWDILTMELSFDFELPFELPLEDKNISLITITSNASSPIICNNKDSPYTCSSE